MRTSSSNTRLATFSVAALVNVVANYLLIPPFGASGTAAATAGSVALVGIGLWFFSRRHFPRRMSADVACNSSIAHSNCGLAWPHVLRLNARNAATVPALAQ